MANQIVKKYLMSYENIVLAIRFLITHRLFAKYMVCIPV